MQLTVDHLPLFVQPAFRRVVPTLQNDVVALQSAGEVVPRRGNQGIFSLEILDHLIRGVLCIGEKRKNNVSAWGVFPFSNRRRCVPVKCRCVRPAQFLFFFLTLLSFSFFVIGEGNGKTHLLCRKVLSALNGFEFSLQIDLVLLGLFELLRRVVSFSNWVKNGIARRRRKRWTLDSSELFWL